MTHQCGCGGKWVTVSDNRAYFRVRCVECGRQCTQRKRRSATKAHTDVGVEEARRFLKALDEHPELMRKGW